ncbi:MAG: 2-oxoacid:acceptor oxidoreductase family protein [Elusimicrobia bacterium]|jgi:2-oxoglutarate ferredoxin oxidoreductase subunit gamma|nr:2-oxoacid:acceptor oxidoreductase family protein [Elusimicrobiota bacterium]
MKEISLKETVLISGFGGQGVMLAGRLICRAGMDEDKFVTFFPSYGAEMRGGTANCQVIISDEPIGSPVVDTPDFLICFNKPSFIKFSENTADDSSIIINSDLYQPENSGNYDLYKVPANNIAEECGNLLAMNSAMAGAFASLSNMITLDTLKGALPVILTKRKEKYWSLNIKAAEKGFDYISSL